MPANYLELDPPDKGDPDDYDEWRDDMEADAAREVMQATTCPNCGSVGDFTEHMANSTERHGLDCGPYEHFVDVWLTCNKCGARTDDEESELEQARRSR